MKKYIFKNVPHGDKRNESWKYLKEGIFIRDFIKSSINRDNIVIYDIGSNIMDHTVFFANEFKGSKVCSFEPVKEYYEMGIKNVKEFKLNNVIPFNVGIGDTKGILKISINNESSSFVANRGSEYENIKIETIDDMVKSKKIPTPSFIKIDVEGFGYQAIKGGYETIKKHKPIIMFEHHPHLKEIATEDVENKWKLLAELGYSVSEELSAIEYLLVFDGKGDCYDYISNKYGFFDDDMRKAYFKKRWARSEMWKIRGLYDSAEKKEDRAKLRERYSKVKYFGRPWMSLLLWSKLYVFFTFKWL